MVIRCNWAEHDDLMRKYHDEEWGVPVHDDNFLKLRLNIILELDPHCF